MEIKIKLKKWKLREEGPTRNQKWGILKYLSAEIFTETSEIDQVKLRMNVGSNDTCQWYLRSKIGVWQQLFPCLASPKRGVKNNSERKTQNNHSQSLIDDQTQRKYKCHLYAIRIHWL